MTTDHEEACYLFGEIVERMCGPLTATTNTYKYIARCVDVAADQVILEDVELYRKMAEHPDLGQYITNRDEISDGAFKRRVEAVVTGELTSAKKRVASASLVFAHTIFEGCVLDCLKVAFLAAPTEWLPLVGTKSATLEELNTKGLESVQYERITRLLAGLERESLPKKLAVFFQLTRPTEGETKIKNYRYDRARIEALDLARHTAAHGDPTAYDPEKLESDVAYLRLTIMHLVALLINRFKVKTVYRPGSVY